MRKVFLDNLPRGGKNVNKNKIDWGNSIGSILNFVYDNIKGELEILDYDKNKKKILIKYKDQEYWTATVCITKNHLKEMLGLINHKYKYNIGDIITNINSGKLQILDQIKIKDMHNKNQKFYKYKCLICGNEDIIKESNLIRHKGCNVCCIPTRKILKGYNDMWTTNPDLAKLLANPNDGYKYTQNSGEKTNWKCSNCGNIIKNKRIYSINRNGLSCPKCSDGISYPEKFMFNVLQQLNIDFIYQLSKNNLKWCDKYKYDFYFKINNEEYIIETHGIQHYSNVTSFKSYNDRNLKEEQKNDKLKKELAIKNGIKIENYIVIDCRKSELEWVKEHVLQSELNNILNLSKIDWLGCHKFACSSLIKKACDLWNQNKYSTNEIGGILNICAGTIRNYLKQGTKLNWCNYNPKEVQIQNGKVCSGKNSKKIICLNTKYVFNSIIEIASLLNINESSIVNCCKGKSKHAGRDPITGEKLQWQYYNEYLVNPKRLLLNDEMQHYRQKIICLNTNKIFNSIKEANQWINLNSSGSIVDCCRGRQKSAGKNPITGEKLRWMYYDEYIEKYKKAI